MSRPALPIGECFSRAACVTVLQPVMAARAFWPLICAEIATLLLTDSEWRVAPMLASLLLVIPCACAWHRYLIEGQTPRLSLGLPEWKYMKRALVITLVITVITVPFAVAFVLLRNYSMLVGWTMLVLGLATSIWATGPGMLSLSAAALNRDLNRSGVSNLVAGNKGRLFALLFGVSVSEVALSLGTDSLGAAGPALRLVVSVIFWPLAVAVLSMAYVWLTTGSTSVTTDAQA
ncbi:MAG TPA: hypothetical protein VK196_22645 [Magnetospirillum sp.]|nr:hypothetical protein [Magnetospirillum sp.]